MRVKGGQSEGLETMIYNLIVSEYDQEMNALLVIPA